MNNSALMVDSLMSSRNGRLASNTSRSSLMDRPMATTAVAAAASLPSSFTWGPQESQLPGTNISTREQLATDPPPGRLYGRRLRCGFHPRHPPASLKTHSDQRSPLPAAIRTDRWVGGSTWCNAPDVAPPPNLADWPCRV